jgi:hypothetical protein
MKPIGSSKFDCPTLRTGGIETAAVTGDVVDGSKLAHALAQVLTGAKVVKIPAESFLTFRLEQSLDMGSSGRWRRAPPA